MENVQARRERTAAEVALECGEDWENELCEPGEMLDVDAAKRSQSTRSDETRKERTWVHGAMSAMWHRTAKVMLIVLATAGAALGAANLSPDAFCGASHVASAAGLLSPESAEFVCDLCHAASLRAVHCGTCRMTVCPMCDVSEHSSMHQHSRTAHMLDGVRFALDAEEFLAGNAVMRQRLPPAQLVASNLADCTCRKCMEPMTVTSYSCKDMLVWTMSGAFKCSIPLLACLSDGCGYERTATSSDVRQLLGLEALNPHSPSVVLTRELLAYW